MEIVLGVLGGLLAVLIIRFAWRARRLADAAHGTDAAATIVDGDPGLGYDGDPDGDGGGDGGGGGGDGGGD